jgi:predicted RNA methylase
VDTSGEINLCRLDISSGNEIHGTRYQASPADACERLFAFLPIHYEDFTFADLGAGKGRVLLVASRFNFRRIVGVEFARELVEIARRNMERYGCRCELVHCDAAEYEFPADNLVVYLYNPFGPEVLRRVLTALKRVRRTRDVYMIYLHPMHVSCIADAAVILHTIDGAVICKVNRTEAP